MWRLIEKAIVIVLTALLTILVFGVARAGQRGEQAEVYRRLVLVILASILLLIVIGAYFSAFILASILIWVIKHGRQ